MPRQDWKSQPLSVSQLVQQNRGGSRMQPPVQKGRLFPRTGRGFSVHRWKLLETLLRRPSVQTTCSGQCRCTVVCTLVRLGKGEQRHGLLGTKLPVSKRTFVSSLFLPFSFLFLFSFLLFLKFHIQCFLHRFCTLGTTNPPGTPPEWTAGEKTGG